MSLTTNAVTFHFGVCLFSVISMASKSLQKQNLTHIYMKCFVFDHRMHPFNYDTFLIHSVCMCKKIVYIDIPWYWYW
jgi:hypothetical protein